MGLLYGENCKILTSTVFCMNHPCDGQTDGRNYYSICALSIYAVARKSPTAIGAVSATNSELLSVGGAHRSDNGGWNE